MTAEKPHQCPLCGFTFDATALTCHTSCPLSKGCNIVCCPNCGYQVPDEDRMRVAGSLKRAWKTHLSKREETRA